jgi:hypothetical protein
LEEAHLRLAGFAGNLKRRSSRPPDGCQME